MFLKIQIIILIELINFWEYPNYQNLLPILYIYFMSLSVGLKINNENTYSIIYKHEKVNQANNID